MSWRRSLEPQDRVHRGVRELDLRLDPDLCFAVGGLDLNVEPC